MRKKLLWTALITPLILSLLGVNMINISATATHDLAVASVTPFPTEVRLGELVNITVVVENQGNFTETSNVTVHYDATAIEKKINITLAAGANTSLTFAWNTMGVIAGTYNINATVNTVPGEEDKEDNTLVSSSTVRVVSPYIAVIPERTVDETLTPGMNYTVSIYTDYNGSDVQSYQFTLSYNPRVLRGVEVTNGDLITTEKDPSAQLIAGTFDNTAGELSLTLNFFFFYLEPAPITSGPGTLANVTFTVVGYGTSNITLGEETKLIGYTDGGYGDPYSIIDYITDISEPLHSGRILQSYFRNTEEEVIHDIAVESVTPSPTEVRLGELVNITVVVENQGTESENVTVEVLFDYKPGLTHSVIGTKSVTNLENGISTTLNFTWNTTDVKVGNHTITAVAEPVHGETDTDDNTLESPQIVTVKRREEEPLPILPIIGIVLVVVVVIAVVVYAISRRKKTTPE